jgi:excisionase family DNA binding protein
MENRLLTGNEVAKYLQVSSAQAYKLMKQGEIRTIKFGRCVRVRDIDLDEFVHRNLSNELSKGDYLHKCVNQLESDDNSDG